MRLSSLKLNQNLVKLVAAATYFPPFDRGLYLDSMLFRGLGHFFTCDFENKMEYLHGHKYDLYKNWTDWIGWKPLIWRWYNANWFACGRICTLVFINSSELNIRPSAYFRTAVRFSYYVDSHQKKNEWFVWLHSATSYIYFCFFRLKLKIVFVQNFKI